MMKAIFGIIFWSYYQLNYSCVYRTAPATPGLLNILTMPSVARGCSINTTVIKLVIPKIIPKMAFIIPVPSFLFHKQSFLFMSTFFWPLTLNRPPARSLLCTWEELPWRSCPPPLIVCPCHLCSFCSGADEEGAYHFLCWLYMSAFNAAVSHVMWLPRILWKEGSFAELSGQLRS